MKKGLHPEYRLVDTATFEGKEYPVIKVAISSTSHPFYTGKSKFVDETGRVDKFKKKYNL